MTLPALVQKLQADHVRLLDLSVRLVTACKSAKPLDRMTAIKTAAEIASLARVHQGLEEAQLLPFLARSAKTGEAVHLIEEHHASDRALGELVVTLRRGAPAGPSADAWARELRSHIEHEGRIFDALDATLRAG